MFKTAKSSIKKEILRLQNLRGLLTSQEELKQHTVYAKDIL